MTNIKLAGNSDIFTVIEAIEDRDIREQFITKLAGAALSSAINAYNYRIGVQASADAIALKHASGIDAAAEAQDATAIKHTEQMSNMKSLIERLTEDGMLAAKVYNNICLELADNDQYNRPQTVMSRLEWQASNEPDLDLAWLNNQAILLDLPVALLIQNEELKHMQRSTTLRNNIPEIAAAIEGAGYVEMEELRIPAITMIVWTNKVINNIMASGLKKQMSVKMGDTLNQMRIAAERALIGDECQTMIDLIDQLAAENADELSTAEARGYIVPGDDYNDRTILATKRVAANMRKQYLALKAANTVKAA